MPNYLSRRSSRIVLKHYLDAFGFAGVQIDKVLRIFLQSIHIPSQVSHGANALTPYWTRSRAAGVRLMHPMSHTTEHGISFYESYCSAE